MNEKLPLKERIAKEKEKFSKMDASTKKRYFRDYYLVPCLLSLALIIAVAWFAIDVFTSKKTVYSGATVGFDITDSGNEYLTEGFIKSLGSKYKRKKAELSRDTTATFSDGAKYDNMSIELAFTSQVSTGMYQYVILTEASFEHFSGYQFFVPLSDYSSSDKYASLDYVQTSSGESLGIRLSDQEKKNIGYLGEEELIFTFVYSGEHEDLNDSFIDYLFLGGQA